ncbi:C-terminal binding protein [Microbacterium sp. NPDC090003]|uniref:C-terminal binding protein n=1 Tax=Microbacterium sp. NPDC090003 TaxID=3364203 RepID=UPI003804A2FF
MTTPFILVSDCDLPGTVIEDTLRAADLRADRAPSPAPDDLAGVGADAVGLVVQWAPITAEVLDRMPHLRIISRVGIGYDMIDVEAATARGIAVANTPSYCIEEVTAHTIAMIMTQARGLPAYDRAVRAGTWKAVDARPLAVRPSSTTVSVLGFGRIGSIVARGCRALGFRVLVADPYASDDGIRSAGCEPVEIPDAVAQADILTLHVPLTEATRHLIDASSIATMKPGAVVVNTCRGPLIDERALADALRSAHLGAAALDVFDGEPLAEDSPLRDLDQVLLSPHAAWFSPEALADLPVHAAENVMRFLAGESVPIVNPTYAG